MIYRSQLKPARPTYDRKRDLACLLPLWPEELAAETLSDRRDLVAKLRRALRVERQRGKAGSTGYDLARHAALLDAYRAEKAELRNATSETNRTYSLSVRKPGLLPLSTPYGSLPHRHVNPAISPAQFPQ